MTADDRRVVACVVSRGDLLLLAQRPPHKRHGGLWEFPGGKVEPGESDAHAAARELGVELLRASPVMFEATDPGSPFVIAFVPVEIRGDPVPTEHSALTWGRASELIDLPLAPSDAAFLRWLLARSI